eukprot:s1670_g1.t1
MFCICCQDEDSTILVTHNCVSDGCGKIPSGDEVQPAEVDEKALQSEVYTAHFGTQEPDDEVTATAAYIEEHREYQTLAALSPLSPPTSPKLPKNMRGVHFEAKAPKERSRSELRISSS